MRASFTRIFVNYADATGFAAGMKRARLVLSASFSLMMMLGVFSLPFPRGTVSLSPARVRHSTNDTA